MPIRTTIILLFVFFLAHSACKKYPEEGSHERARHKIYGIWELSKISINNNDSTSSYSIYAGKYEFENSPFDVNFRCADTTNGTLCYWDLKRCKKKLYFGSNKCKDKDNCSGGIFYVDDNATEWDILVLTDEKMKLRATSSYNGREYTFVLEKVK